MRPLQFIIAMLLITSADLSSQADSTAFVYGAEIPDGIYLTHNNLRHNRAILKQQLTGNEDKAQHEFIGKLLSRKEFSYNTSVGTQTVQSKDVYGFFQNNVFYVNFNGEFFRVPVFGSISFLVANVLVYRNFYDPRFGYPSGTTTNTELRQFLIDYYDGAVLDFNLNEAERLLKRDPALYEEFRKLSKRKKRERVHGFIRSYNEKHPVYFLK